MDGLRKKNFLNYASVSIKKYLSEYLFYKSPIFGLEILFLLFLTLQLQFENPAVSLHLTIQHSGNNILIVNFI